MATVPSGIATSAAVVPGGSAIVVSIRESHGDAWLIDLAKGADRR